MHIKRVLLSPDSHLSTTHGGKRTLSGEDSSASLRPKSYFLGQEGTSGLQYGPVWPSEVAEGTGLSLAGLFLLQGLPDPSLMSPELGTVGVASMPPKSWGQHR